MKPRLPSATARKIGSVIVVSMSFLVGLAVHAENTRDSPGWNGTAGVGPIAFPRYVGGKHFRIWPIPLLSINYNDTFYVELQRVGVYVFASDDKKAGLGMAVEPRFGYSSGDGIRLRGMATRRDSLEGGPTFDWDFDVVAISVAWFRDLDRSSRGQSLRAAIYAPILKNETWEIGTLLAADSMNGRLANYYFGVTESEATARRRRYRPGGGTNISLGLSGTYRLNKGHAVMFGLNASRLSNSVTGSPLVETRHADMFYLGYGWIL